MTILRRAELAAVRFAAERIDALVAAIDINDRIDLDAALPTTVRLHYPAERFVEGFALSRQLWREGFDPPALTALAIRLKGGGQLDADTGRWFKQVRARFKHLRFAFFLYAAGHRSPAMLSLVTLVMGELQDAVRVRHARDVARHAARLQLLLSRPARLLLAHEVDRLVPSDAAAFRRFTVSQIASLAPLLATPVTGAHAFHAARKVVSRQVSFHDDMRTLNPYGEQAVEHRAMARWLATLNGLMGQFHDELVTQNAAGTFRYARDTFALPEDIRARLEALVPLYLATRSSNPPSA